jgi:2-polyprenyl-3-methyl-5-hydroxy-6-metoxy-1,4-benzoquinol methylase
MSDRKQHWEKVYQSKSPHEVSWFQAVPELSLRLMRSAGIALNEPVIDIGGGASKLVDALYNEGYSDISVLDVSTSALTHAKKRLGNKASNITWYDQDITQFTPPKQFSLWHDRAVFHFLTHQADRDSYIAVLKKALKPGGHLIIMAFATDGPVKCSGLEIVQYDTTKLINALGPGFDLVEDGYEIHKTPVGNQQKFAYFMFTRTPDIP